MPISLESLRDFLVESRLVSARDFALVVDEAKEFVGEGVDLERKVEDILLNKGLISEDDFRRAQAYLLGISFVDISKEKITKEALFMIPEPIARKYNIVSYKKKGETLEVAMLDLKSLEQVSFLERGGLRIIARLTDTESIKNVLVQYQKLLRVEFGEILQRESMAIKNQKQLDGSLLVETLLKHASLQKATSIHLEVFNNDLIVRYRIAGFLHDAIFLPVEILPIVSETLSVLVKAGLSKFGLTGSVDFLPTAEGDRIVINFSLNADLASSLESFGFDKFDLERIYQTLQGKTGLILVTEQVESNNANIIYSLLESLNTPEFNIVTLEDKIEKRLARINQIQIRPDIGFNFVKGLRSILRQDPDIIMVGEIRDQETANLVISASQTGHLVLAGVKTKMLAQLAPSLSVPMKGIIIANGSVHDLSSEG